jgi:hypothetical protein
LSSLEAGGPRPAPEGAIKKISLEITERPELDATFFFLLFVGKRGKSLRSLDAGGGGEEPPPVGR